MSETQAVTQNPMVGQFKTARRVSTPLISIRTADQPATIELLSKALTNGNTPAMIEWDIVRGPRDLNAPGKQALSLLLGENNFGIPDIITILDNAVKLPAKSVLFLHNAHKQLDNIAFIQAVSNLRDSFRSNFRQLVLLAPDMTLPPELRNDVLMLDEVLPNEEQLRALILQNYKDAELTEPDQTTLTSAIAAVSGLAHFPADQAVAMSLTPNGLDIPSLWLRKDQAINETPGLEVCNPNITFENIGGVEQAKNYFRQLFNGKNEPRVVVWIDEIEKAFAGLGANGGPGDSSGTTQDQLGQLLQDMNDCTKRGVLFYGPPGSAKSVTAQAIGSAGPTKVKVIRLDLGGMKGSLVGESEAKLRAALKVVNTVSDRRVLYVATCNTMAVLPPELRRRFKMGTFFFDLPTPEERAAIWSIYLAKFELDLLPATAMEAAQDSGWTGAEIETCCQLASELNISVTEAARYIVPVSRSSADLIDGLRQQATGKFLSATHPGVYVYQREQDQAVKATANKRAFNLND